MMQCCGDAYVARVRVCVRERERERARARVCVRTLQYVCMGSGCGVLSLCITLEGNTRTHRTRLARMG